jgi:uncharacterized membrane protein YeiH
MQIVFDLLGLFVFATSGALLAIRKDFDAVGIVLLAELTANGGGVLRDLIIGVTPPAMFTNLGYLVVPVVAAAVTFFAHPAVERLMTPVLIFDAAGLGLFCVTGTLKALDHGLGPLQAAALGVTTGVGGGLLRDIVAREIPALVRPETELYSVPALAGALVVVAARPLHHAQSAIEVGAALFIFVFRLVALVRGWRAPLAWRRRSSRSE